MYWWKWELLCDGGDVGIKIEPRTICAAMCRIEDEGVLITIVLHGILRGFGILCELSSHRSTFLHVNKPCAIKAMNAVL